MIGGSIRFSVFLQKSRRALVKKEEHARSAGEAMALTLSSRSRGSVVVLLTLASSLRVDVGFIVACFLSVLFHVVFAL